jgi:hypothetical protein
MLFEVKTARSSIVFMNLKTSPLIISYLQKTPKTRIFSNNRFIFQNDARILASF